MFEDYSNRLLKYCAAKIPINGPNSRRRIAPITGITEKIPITMAKTTATMK